MTRKFNVLIEQDEDGTFIGRVPELKGCITQGDSLDELMKNMKEAVELYLEIEDGQNNEEKIRFLGVQQIEVA
ncbi:MAG: type II toxin-antitoxin system HicB family antitoxin [Candidatus Nanoarchaeia archaeon]